MADIVDINISQTVETVDIIVTPNLVTVNINQITGGGGGATNLGYTPSSTNGIVTSDTGTDATIPLADATNAGLLTPVEKTKIANIPTATNQITNNGADGVNPFITALDIPTQNQASTLVREVKNMTGATLTKGTVVYISGANGNKALVSKALATTDALSSRTFGMLQSDILNNGLGNCVIIGDLSGIDTSAFAEGAQLYLSGTTAGTYTSTKNLAPTHLVYVGKVTRVHPTLGQIEVGIQNGYELNEIHDVQISGLFDGDVLQYESSTQLWKNKYFLIDDADFASSVNTFNATYLDTKITDLANLIGTNLTYTNQTYTGTIVWTGGTAPSGATQHTYSLSRVRNLVTLTINLSYATAGGAALTSVAFELPNTAPTPASVTSVGEILNYGTGMLAVAKTIPTTNAAFCALRIKSTSPNVYEVIINRTASTYKYAYATIQYFV